MHTAFNSLFEMLDGFANAWHRIVKKAFNSLFEMQEEVKKKACFTVDRLSILYLRCAGA